MTVKNGAKLYPASKKSSNGIKALEDLEREMKQEKQKIDRIQQSIEDYDTGWSDDFEDTPVKRAALEKELKASEQSCAELEKEWKAAKQNQPVQEKQWKTTEQNQPEREPYLGDYAKAFEKANGFEKAAAGIFGSTVATVPVVVETTAAALREAERKGMAADYTAALQAEEIAKNKMNDYVSSFFGFYDLIDPEELARLEQAYQQATEYRKSLETKYEEPVNMNSWGMKTMRDSAWLKNSATENLNGFWKGAADLAIDVGQGIALSPLMLAGGGAYTAGVAANAAAEDMYNQTAKGRTASEALGSGALTAGAEVAGAKISGIKNKAWKEATEDIAAGTKWLIKAKRPPTEMVEIFKYNPTLKRNFTVGIGREAGREAALLLTDHLADELWREPENKLSWGDVAQSATEDISSRIIEKREEKIAKAAKRFWDTLGR